jgi:predicted DCC family thiol-disulfide oxidoreductase YuxK
MNYLVIYDGNCNLCVTFTQLLEKFDRGQIFTYIPMQDEINLKQFGITSADCQMGMILIDAQNPDRRWQGSNAAEEITRLLPLGDAFITAYRALPGMKLVGDRVYEQVRDNRYQWFGKRDSTYYSTYNRCSK